MTIKNLTLIFCAITIASLYGCASIKNEDNTIKEALTGKYYEEDYVDKNGNKLKNIKGEFYKDGKFRTEGTFELVDDEALETTDITINIKGDWKVKENFIYYTYDFNSLKIVPDHWELLMKDKMIETLKNENSPDKVIKYDASKIIYENSDEERHTMKKSY